MITSGVNTPWRLCASEGLLEDMKILQKNFLGKYFIIAMLAGGASPAFAQVSMSVNIAPPPLQVYTQPACPDDGYLWTPGYWAYENNAYYWVPGAWVQPPQVGELWTPPYWGWDGSAYAFYPGYWGPNVGFYGGVNYGYGYGGNGYRGGRWEGGHFSYNTAVNNVSSTNFHHTYMDRTATSSNSSHVSYNGGNGGLQTQPTAQERQYSSQHHAVTPPPTQQDAFRPQAVPSAQGGSGATLNPPPKPEPQAPSVSQDTHPAESHEAAVKPHDKPEVAPQTHSAPPADTQSHSGPPAQTQSHPEAPATPKVQSNQPEPH
jgi:hypothetical protein